MRRFRARSGAKRLLTGSPRDQSVDPKQGAHLRDRAVRWRQDRLGGKHHVVGNRHAVGSDPGIQTRQRPGKARLVVGLDRRLQRRVKLLSSLTSPAGTFSRPSPRMRTIVGPPWSRVPEQRPSSPLAPVPWPRPARTP